MIDRENQTDQKDLLIEYILHEALEKARIPGDPVFKHRLLILITTALLHPEQTDLIKDMLAHLDEKDTTPGIRGRTELGKTLRDFIDSRLPSPSEPEALSRLSAHNISGSIEQNLFDTMEFTVTRGGVAKTYVATIQGSKDSSTLTISLAEKGRESKPAFIRVATSMDALIRLDLPAAFVEKLNERYEQELQRAEYELGDKVLVLDWIDNRAGVSGIDDFDPVDFLYTIIETMCRRQGRDYILREVWTTGGLIKAIDRGAQPVRKEDIPEFEEYRRIIQQTRSTVTDPRQRQNIYEERLPGSLRMSLVQEIRPPAAAGAGLPTAMPMTRRLEDAKRTAVSMTDILREISFAETVAGGYEIASSPLTSSMSRAPRNDVVAEVRKTTLIIGIPKETNLRGSTPGVVEVVRERLAALGRVDVLVIPVDREEMQEKLDKLGVPFGVILDVDNVDDIDKLLEPFMQELDLQGLYRDYSAVIRHCERAEGKAFSRERSEAGSNLKKAGLLRRPFGAPRNDDELLKIVYDKRLMPRIASLNLEYMFSGDIDACLKKYPTTKYPKKPKPYVTSLDLAMIIEERRAKAK